jgi:hypothetical protein
VGRTLRLTLAFFASLPLYQWVNGTEAMTNGGGHEATRRIREINADQSVPWMIETRATPRGRWEYRRVPRWADEDGQLVVWGERAQLGMFD